MSTLTPNAAVLSLVAPSTSASFGAISRFPVIGYVSISSPSVTAVKTLTVTPTPVALTSSAPSVIRHWSVLPSAVATLRPATNPVPSVTIFAIEPETFDQTFTPARSVLLLSAPQVLRIGGDVTISNIVPAFLEISARMVTRVSGPISLSPDPVAFALGVPSVAIDSPLTLSPDPTALQSAVPEVNVATDRTLAPAASSMTFSATSIDAIDFGAIDLFPEVATLSHAVPSPSVLPGEKVLQPVPAALTSPVPTPVVWTTDYFNPSGPDAVRHRGHCLVSKETDASALVSVNVTGTSEIST